MNLMILNYNTISFNSRKILLIEPNYKNKYPPLGLMKISAYHKLLGDEVVFFKGNKNEYIFDEKYNSCVDKINNLNINFKEKYLLPSLIRNYLKYRHNDILSDILNLTPFDYIYTVENNLRYFAHKFKPQKKWDRIYITTLFTFYWKQIQKSIELAKLIIKDSNQLYVGGVAATLIPEIISEETGLIIGKNIITGLLDKPGIFDDNNIIIDEITPDYSILETLDYRYPLDTGFLSYMTKGCTRSCSFCAVPKLEPIYKNKISIKNQIENIRNSFGDRKDLILMDNNVLGSPKFKEIVSEILEMGFSKDSKFIEPNYFSILVKHLKNDKSFYNKKKYLKKIYNYLFSFGNKRIRNVEKRLQFFQLLHDKKLDVLEAINKEAVISSFNDIYLFIEKYRNKAKKSRYVDFNQGIDCRYVDEEKMKLLSQLPIRPMRIAFDHLSLRKSYENAIRLAAKYGIKELSNYILFNYKDKPEDLWQRLKINIVLNIELETNIFSFPMKYIPLYGRDSLTRSYVGKYWNKKYLRAIQNILNVLKGICMPGKEFFEKAFGKTLEEYFDILIMPESYIIYRFHFEENGKKNEWYYQYKNLNKHELEQAKDIIFTNDFFSFNGHTSKAVVEFMKHYQKIWEYEEILSNQSSLKISM